MKIGRPGVSADYKNQGYGRAVPDFLKYWFIDNNRTICRYITVDAYKQSLKFYEKNGFDYLTESDVDKDTRAVFFDLEILPVES